MKRILIDIGHPGHVHLFKHVAHHYIDQGHAVLFTVRDKECEIELLKHEGFSHISFGKHYKTIKGKLWGLLKFDAKMLQTALRFKPDLFLSHGSIYAAHAAGVMGKPHLSLEDSGNMEQIRLYRPFTHTILTPSIFNKDLGPKQVKYKGYHELAYLHPNRFSPKRALLESAGVDVDQPFAVLRFISWNASHDRGQHGLSNDQKTKLIEHLSQKMKVFISAEVDLPEHLGYQLKIEPYMLHDLLDYATIVISEGATIAAEAAVLGTRSAYINSIKVSYCKDLETYGLLEDLTDKPVITKVDELLAMDPQTLQQRREKMLADKIDVSEFLIDFIESNYFMTEIKKEKEISHAL